MGGKVLDTNQKVRQFYTKQIPIVYIPCLIWSLPSLLLAIAHNGISQLPKDLAYYFFCGYKAYYFILLIIQCYLLLPLLQKCKSTWALLTLTFITYMIHVSIVQYPLHQRLPLVVYGAPFTLLGFYFVLGMALGKAKRNYSLWIPVLGMIIGTLLQMIETVYINKSLGGGFGIKPSSIVYCTSVILLLFSSRLEVAYNNNENKLGKLFRWVGGLSFGMYLVHFHIIALLPKVHIDFNFYSKWAILFICSAVIVAIGQKISPTFSKKYLGFR